MCLVELRAKTAALTAILATLYAVGVIALAPVSFLVIQCRVADALLALSVVYGWSAILGTTLGCVVANMYGGLGIVDIVGGSIANFVATFAGYVIAKRVRGELGIWLALITEALIVAAIVGSYLSVLLNIPLWLSLLGILSGSVVSICLLGYALVKVVKRLQI